MSKPIVYLVTSTEFPHLDSDDQGLPDALAQRGIAPQVVCWNDPAVDWRRCDLAVIRSARDYAANRESFLAWTKTVPRLLNHPDILEWNTDKHYMKDLAKHGLPIVPTTWLEPGRRLTKHQVHTRFPAYGDFVVKPSISSGARDIGRYTAIDPAARVGAIEHAMDLLSQGRSVMIQRYLDEVDVHGELSLVYMNGLVSHAVEKEAMLHPSKTTDWHLQEQVVRLREATPEEWQWGELARSAIHALVKDRLGHDLMFLYTRIDIVADGQGKFYVMEVSMTDASLYLGVAPEAMDRFADAISCRVY